MTARKLAPWILAILIGSSACGGTADLEPRPEPISDATLSVTSTAFESEDSIPPEYSCDGEDASPPLSWSVPPEGTQSLVLIVDDPDAPAGTWTHWILFDIPASARSLPRAVPSDAIVDGAGTNGRNSWDRLGYGGPCPPNGPAHRYYFTLYALDTELDLEAGADKATVEQAMAGHILTQGQLMGYYSRP
ncbi:MAG: YbhB/YbcL family Raf kinase inhibitor-like protein [Anaerolineae bacterium]|jgi:Raf kinase inhibitor-like YbhB/YbcL family protein